MELPPNDLNNNPHLRSEWERGKRKDVMTDLDNAKAQRLASLHARRAGTPEPTAKVPWVPVDLVPGVVPGTSLLLSLSPFLRQW